MLQSELWLCLSFANLSSRQQTYRLMWEWLVCQVWTAGDACRFFHTVFFFARQNHHHGYARSRPQEVGQGKLALPVAHHSFSKKLQRKENVRVTNRMHFSLGCLQSALIIALNSPCSNELRCVLAQMLYYVN